MTRKVTNMFDVNEENDKFIRKSRRLSYVPRWVVVPTIRKQVVDQHSYQVAQIARWLMYYHRNQSSLFRLEVVESALDHDIDEALTGDRPTPSKTDVSPITNMQAKVVIKCADILEAICFMEEESAMGNQVYSAAVIMERKAAFHDWWQNFDWFDGPTRTRHKPLSHDIIQYLVHQFVRPIHPAMEPKE